MTAEVAPAFAETLVGPAAGIAGADGGAEMPLGDFDGVLWDAEKSLKDIN